ncbi:hypothetical protein QYE76_042391 [Lolium multiflorum]|uniref:Ribonuclease H1 N-terminal domain-containing protein n=1 Tax=Lolium multiflorum TaxID=4521 RepID=A0AAD8WX95_LOLMU|nr:hypothetical protein QYE76_042391 [Lolium multiflorum]
MENYSLLMGDSSGDEDGGGVDGEAFRGHFPVPAACRNRDSCPPDLGFAMAAALEDTLETYQRVPGVYEEWEECKKQVHKFSGNCYKGYPTRHEAVAKWRAHQSNKSKMKTFLVLSLLLTIVAAVLYFILV